MRKFYHHEENLFSSRGEWALMDLVGFDGAAGFYGVNGFCRFCGAKGFNGQIPINAQSAHKTY